MMSNAPIKTCLLLAVMLLSLTSCTSRDAAQLTAAMASERPEKALANYAKAKGKAYQASPAKLLADLQRLPELFAQLESAVQGVWALDKVRLPGNKTYVKYTNDYQSMAEVDFANGFIRVETIATTEPLAQLKQAIVMTLLTSEDPAATDIFSSAAPTIEGKPYLLGQVLDQDAKAIAYRWRANRFADYLLDHGLKRRKLGRHHSHYVNIQMVREHSQLRQRQYSTLVLAAAKRYQVRADLIYAIIETESSFNPFAISRANAYGLMQIIPTTAGKDVYDKVLNKPGMPSRQTLFDPGHNINIGTAYLQLLRGRYLAKINQQQSRHYAVISAYNGGAGNVFNTFSQDRTAAVRLINQLTASRVYQKLTTAHPKAESRRYLQKVLKAQSNYQ